MEGTRKALSVIEVKINGKQIILRRIAEGAPTLG
jgi:hypothetical protein